MPLGYPNLSAVRALFDASQRSSLEGSQQKHCMKLTSRSHQPDDKKINKEIMNFLILLCTKL